MKNGFFVFFCEVMDFTGKQVETHEIYRKDWVNLDGTLPALVGSG